MRREDWHNPIVGVTTANTSATAWGCVTQGPPTAATANFKESRFENTYNCTEAQHAVADYVKTVKVVMGAPTFRPVSLLQRRHAIR